MEVHLGTSGWSYKEWEGPFYPKGEKKKLTYYSKFFDTVEIDSTFYGYPSKGMILGATKSTPPGFVFSAKLPKLITHEKKLDLEKGVKEDLFRFLRLMLPLIEEGKLGPLLIQLPPSFGYSEGLKKLDGFLEVLPTDVSFAVEFRNKSWLGKADALDLLRGHNVAVTTVDEPLLPPDTTTTADFAFVRWHGRGERPWYNYRYRAGRAPGMEQEGRGHRHQDEEGLRLLQQPLPRIRGGEQPEDDGAAGLGQRRAAKAPGPGQQEDRRRVQERPGHPGVSELLIMAG